MTALPTGSARALADFFLPPACIGCGSRLADLESREPVCPRCRSRLRALPAPRCRRCGIPRGTGAEEQGACEECAGWPSVLRHARSAVDLEPPADRLVHALKYGGWRTVAPVMARRMAGLRLPSSASPDEAVVVPVATTRTRRRRRGYNQAAVLAEAVSERLGRPLANVLRRRSGRRTQVALHPRERERNVRRSFSVRPEGAFRVRERPVLLIDDVLTTGATAGAAARALETAGVESVVVLTFARALPYRAAVPEG